MKFQKTYSAIAATILVAILFCCGQSFAATTLLPNGKQCFSNANGALVAGSINMYIPSTTTPKATWQDSNQVSLNTQPIILDSNGCAVIYGVGAYRQQVFDANSVLQWDQITTDTSAFNAVFWSGLAGGTPNAITVVDTGFNGTDGSVINFTALATNTGPTTLNVSGFGAVSIVKNTTSGPVVLSGGEIVTNNQISVIFSAQSNTFTLLNAVIQSASNTSAPLCGASGLKILNDVVLPNTKANLIASQVVMQSPTGGVINRSNVNVGMSLSLSGAGGLDTGSSAANTWYFVWAIDNGSGPAALGSLSATGPTMPSGYTYKCLMGALQTNISNQIIPFIQTGNEFFYQVSVAPLPNIATGVAGTYSTTSPVLAAVTVAGNGFCAPSIATDIIVNASNTWGGNTTSGVLAATNNSWGGVGNGPSGANGIVWPINLVAGTTGGTQARLKLETTQIFWTSSQAGAALACQGSVFSVNAN